MSDIVLPFAIIYPRVNKAEGQARERIPLTPETLKVLGGPASSKMGA